ILDVLAKGGSIASKGAGLGLGWLAGARDVIVHRWLVLRHSLFGIAIGIVPGLGSSIADWLNYGYLVQTAKDKENFGKGDVRGVEPGPRIVENNLVLIFTLVWSLAIANIVGTSISIGFSRPIAALTRVRFPVLFPFIFLLVTIGAYQATRHMGDLILLVAF